MREIEFRGKRIDNGEWIYGYLIIDGLSDKYYIFPKGNSCNETDKIGEEGLLHILTFEVEPRTIGQYTGLKDKNGKKIFEGDIVKKETFDDTKLDFTNISYAKVIYIEELAGFYLVNKDDKILWNVGEDKYNIEVAGNIYDNPELLEGRR